MFQLLNQPIDPSPYLVQLRHSSNGAFVSFEGWVRDHDDGHAVTGLEYEALAVLCESQAQKIFEEIQDQFGVTNVVCLHRVGRLSIGEMSVWIGVSATHRDEAFKACRYIIDELKKRLPIWKKEIFCDGSSQWVNCQQLQATVLTEKDYYARQTILPEIGFVGQEKLKSSRVLVVGAGGLGSAALTSLAQAGVGTIGIVESDSLEVSNLHRQSLYSAANIGKMKIDLAALRLNAVNPFVKIIKFSKRFDVSNFEEIIRDFDIILDCTDNFSTKFLLNDIAVLSRKILIQASIYQLEGQIRVYDPAIKSACLRCLWPQIPTDDCIGNCVVAGVVGIVPNVMGHLQAWEAVKWILQFDERLKENIFIVDFKTFAVNKIKHSPCLSCPVCGKSASIKNILKENYMSSQKSYDLTVELDTIPLEKISEFVFIDVRESAELLMFPVNSVKSLHLAFSQFGSWNFEFQKDKKYLIYCAHGMRSLACVEKLRKKGISNVQSVNNGAEAVNRYFAAIEKAQS